MDPARVKGNEVINKLVKILDEAQEKLDFQPKYFDAAVLEAPAGGYILEFGVGEGTTINRMAQVVPHRQIYGFDWFKGLPEYWKGEIGVGAFAQDAIPEVKKNVTLIEGLFQDTLDNWLQYHPGPVGLAHLDADLYSSTIFVLDRLMPRLYPGSVLIFDEIYGINRTADPNWSHEGKAFVQFLVSSWFDFEPLGGRHREGFAFRLAR